MLTDGIPTVAVVFYGFDFLGMVEQVEEGLF
jgi:hypothetical protein